MAAFGGPPIDGLGTTGGFKLIIENRGNLAPEELDRVTSSIIDDGNNSGVLQGLFSTSRADTPWLNLELDRSKCLALGVQVTDVFNTLQVYVGSYYVNNFNQFGRTWQVNVQADANFRDQVLGPFVNYYQTRHLIENFFYKLKQLRGITTRYDKTARGISSPRSTSPPLQPGLFEC